MTIAVQPPRVDLEKIIANKNPALLRWIPGFVLNYLKRIIHQEEINEALALHHTKKNFEFIDAIINDYLHIQVEAHGLENIPRKGGVIVASNHPLGGPDAMALMQQLRKVRPDQRFLVNDILMNLKNLHELFIPVNKHGRTTAEVLQTIHQAYASENCTLVFPAGLVSRKQNGQVRDLEWHKSFISQSIKYQRPILPVLIQAQNSNWFYNLANWRKKLGIQANIEMLYLADELYKQRNGKIPIIFGPPIPPETFTRERSHKEWAAMVKDYVYQLSTNNAPFNHTQPSVNS